MGMEEMCGEKNMGKCGAMRMPMTDGRGREQIRCAGLRDRQEWRGRMLRIFGLRR